jgi:hypothetical protein
MYINIANSRENLRNLKCQVVYNMIGDVVIKILLPVNPVDYGSKAKGTIVTKVCIDHSTYFRNLIKFVSCIHVVCYPYFMDCPFGFL